MLPKNFKNNLSLYEQRFGPQYRQDMIDEIMSNKGYFPEPISHYDIDSGFIDFVNNEISESIDGEKLDVNIFSLQRWAEYKSEFLNKDNDDNKKLKFISIIKDLNITQGTIHGSSFNIPGFKTYTIVQVPKWDGNEFSVDHYQIPQPIPVDLIYDVKVILTKMEDVNIINQKILRLFSAKRYFIKVKGHFLTMTLDATIDESKVDDIESLKFYSISYKIKLYGYTLEEKDYKVIPGISRMGIFTDLDDKLDPQRNPDSNTLQNKYNISDYLSKIDYQPINTAGVTFIMKKIKTDLQVNNSTYFNNIVFYGVIKGMRPTSEFIKLFIETNQVNTKEIVDRNNIQVDFFSESDDYCFFALADSIPIRNVWFVNNDNTDNIGGLVGIRGNLFPDPILELVNLNGINANFNIYITNYNTEINTIFFR